LERYKVLVMATVRLRGAACKQATNEERNLENEILDNRSKEGAE
jgi:hypothetical protein